MSRSRVSTKPAWFPATVHITPPATHEHWVRAIALRLGIARAPQTNEWKREKYLEVVIQDTKTTFTPPGLKDWLGVKNISAYQGLMLGAIYSRIEELKAVKALVDDELTGRYPTTEEALRLRKKEVAGEPKGLPTEHFWWDRFTYKLPVVVDLTWDDESLLTSFEIWLAGARATAEEAGIKFFPKAIDQSTFAHWHTYQVLGAFDLFTWRDISGDHYTDAAIAAWLWPDHADTYVDRSERLRKVTKPLVAQVMAWHTVEQLSNHWSLLLFAKENGYDPTQSTAEPE